ncbi:MAG: hypothetical protein U0457_01690 [Candidatus Sericytochromatia bacterium]
MSGIQNNNFIIKEFTSLNEAKGFTKKNEGSESIIQENDKFVVKSLSKEDISKIKNRNYSDFSTNTVAFSLETIDKKTNIIDIDNSDIKTIRNKIAESALKAVEEKISYKDIELLDYGNLACAKSISDILNRLEEFDNINNKKDGIKDIECAKLSQTLLKKGFSQFYSTKTPTKLDSSNFKEGDIVFFPRETEQYGLKNMGHVGIVAKDKETGKLVLVNNGYSKDFDQEGKPTNSYSPKVNADSLEDYLKSREVTMILRYTKN